MIASFAREVITRLRYPTRSDHGVDRPNYRATPDELDIGRCWLEPLQSQENNDGRLAVSTGWTVAAPKGADIVSTDHIRYGGTEYEVVGDPQRVPSPTGALDAVRLVLQRWEG